MTTDNLPPLPDWMYRDDLGHRVPSDIRIAMQAYARAAILQERERCAKVCEEVAAPAENTERTIWWNTAVHQCAAAIREGGK